MKDKNFRDRVPSLEKMNKTSPNLTRGGLVDDQGDKSPDGRSYFDEKGAARRRGIDDEVKSEE